MGAPYHALTAARRCTIINSVLRRRRIPRCRASISLPLRRCEPVLNRTNFEQQGAPMKPALEDRIGAEQVAALFGSVTLGVSAAAIASVVLSVIVSRIGHVDAHGAMIWSGFIILCAITHVGLRQLYVRAGHGSTGWRLWAYAFTAI